MTTSADDACCMQWRLGAALCWITRAAFGLAQRAERRNEMHARPYKHRTQLRHRAKLTVIRAASAGIFAMDAALRGWYGVRPYSYTDDILLRIADRKSVRQVLLEDGTRVHPGDPVLDLHIWNERIAVLGLPEGNLGWACRVKNRVRNSLEQLACHLEADPAFHRYVAVRAEAVVLSESAARRFSRIAARFGLKSTMPERSADWGHGMLALLLAWACNPARTFRGRYRPIRREFWISATELRSRYYHLTLKVPAGTLAPETTSAAPHAAADKEPSVHYPDHNIQVRSVRNDRTEDDWLPAQAVHCQSAGFDELG